MYSQFLMETSLQILDGKSGTAYLSFKRVEWKREPLAWIPSVKKCSLFFLYDFYWLNSIHYLKYCIHNIPVSIYFYLLLILSVFIHTIFDYLSSFFLLILIYRYFWLYIKFDVSIVLKKYFTFNNNVSK